MLLGDLGVVAIFGGEALFGFAITMLWGIMSGTYSSVFVASSLLLYMPPIKMGQATKVDAKGAVKDIARAPKGREDYAWLGEGTLVISAGTKILAMKPGADADWREIGDFEALGLKDLTRLATNARGDQIAIVASPK